jgi:hypothetical protein
MAKSGKEFAPATILCGIRLKERFPENIREAMDAIPREKPIGTLKAKQSINTTNKTVSKPNPPSHF